MKLIIIILSFLMLCSCFSKKSNLNKKIDIELQEIAKITSSEQKFSEMTNFKVWNNQIFIVDNAEKKIVVFDNKGKFVSSFGKKGKGPGEFSGIFHIGITPKGTVVINDYEKRKLIKYDVTGKFIEEIKTDQLPLGGSICEIVPLATNYIARFVAYSSSNKEVTKEETIIELTPNFELNKTIYSFGKKTSSPNIMDFAETERFFAVNKLEKSIAVNSGGRLDYKLLLKSINSENSNEIIEKLPLVALTNDDISEMEEEFEWYRKNFPQMNYQLNPLPKNKQVVSQINYDENGRLWVSVPTSNISTKRIYVYNKKHELLGYFEVKADYFEVSGKHLYCYTSEDEENESLSIYQYNLK